MTKKKYEKVRKKLSPGERIVASGYIRSMKSIDKVLDSKYGGYRYKKRK